MEVQQPFFLGYFSIYVDIEIIVDQELIVITFTFRSRRFIFNMQYFPLIFAKTLISILALERTIVKVNLVFL